MSQADMAALLAAGDARPLLPKGIPGPMRLADGWWAVREGADHYQPVTGALAEQLDEHARRLAAAESAVRDAQADADPGRR